MDHEDIQHLMNTGALDTVLQTQDISQCCMIFEMSAVSVQSKCIRHSQTNFRYTSVGLFFLQVLAFLLGVVAVLSGSLSGRQADSTCKEAHKHSPFMTDDIETLWHFFVNLNVRPSCAHWCHTEFQHSSPHGTSALWWAHGLRRTCFPLGSQKHGCRRTGATASLWHANIYATHGLCIQSFQLLSDTAAHFLHLFHHAFHPLRIFCVNEPRRDEKNKRMEWALKLASSCNATKPLQIWTLINHVERHLVGAILQLLT